MIEPRLAAVRPRVLSSETADSVLLEDEVLARLERRQWGPIKLFAGAGCGKSTALAHLAAVLRPDLVDPEGPVLLVDEPDKDEAERIFAERKSRLIVYTGTRETRPRDATVLSLARWGLDECIEYLLAEHKDHCASVMSRLQAAPDLQLLAEAPELIVAILDRLAADETVTDCRGALRAEVYSRLSDDALRRLAQVDCLYSLSESAATWLAAADSILAKLRAVGVQNLLRHETTRLLLAADALADDLRQRGGTYLTRRLPHRLVRETVSRFGENATAVSFLQDVVRGRRRDCHAMAGSLLCAAGVAWKPSTRRAADLAGAYLNGICWPGEQLEKARLSGANLSNADLSEANLDLAHLTYANLTGANLHGASMRRATAAGSQLSGADLSFVRAGDAVFRKANLSHANLEGALLIHCMLAGNLAHARFVRAKLYRACLEGAVVEGADLSQADLSEATLSKLDLRSVSLEGACMQGARLNACNLENVNLPGAQLSRADLEGALLSESVMQRANFQNANLRCTGLADIQWEYANLRDADLRGATFHLGSSRSGLVGSPIACEGSRTGFYTDEYHEQEFKSPEEIRKANLCGADLRGARIDNVDFYLVDLRGAKYTEYQKVHFQRCRAILHARV